jgi:4-amino-4-deoxy-L-arabinose transferase-like glycosyltransferase
MRERARDYAVLVAVAALLTLPNLGAPSLWDVDEGVNAEAAREMRRAARGWSRRSTTSCGPPSR